MQYCLVYACNNNPTTINASTSCKSLVKIGPVSSAENSIESGNYVASRHLFGMLVFENELENPNFDFSRLTGNHFCTLCSNFVKMYEFVRLTFIILPNLVQLHLLQGGAVRQWGDQ